MSKENTKAKKICAALRRELQGTHALPSERALMRRFAAARETVRRALAELESEGLVVRQVGKGTFPSKRARQVPGRIGLIVLSYAEIFAPICAEIGRLCRARGLELLFGDVSALDYTARAEQARRFARDFVAQRVSGVILQPIGFMENAAALNAEMRDLFAVANVPVVLLDSGWPDGLGAADVVGVDNFRCGQALAEHLLAQGARRCLFLTRSYAPPSNRLRYEGVHSRMDCNILQMEPDNATALRKALKRHRPDALACGYDAYAAQVLKTLGGLGRLRAERHPADGLRRREVRDARLAAAHDRPPAVRGDRARRVRGPARAFGRARPHAAHDPPQRPARRAGLHVAKENNLRRQATCPVKSGLDHSDARAGLW